MNVKKTKSSKKIVLKITMSMTEALLVTPPLGLSSPTSRSFPMSDSVYREEGLPTQHR